MARAVERISDFGGDLLLLFFGGMRNSKCARNLLFYLFCSIVNFPLSPSSVNFTLLSDRTPCARMGTQIRLDNHHCRLRFYRTPWLHLSQCPVITTEPFTAPPPCQIKICKQRLTVRRLVFSIFFCYLRRTVRSTHFTLRFSFQYDSHVNGTMCCASSSMRWVFIEVIILQVGKEYLMISPRGKLQKNFGAQIAGVAGGLKRTCSKL